MNMKNTDLVNLLISRDHLKTPEIIQAFQQVDRKIFVFNKERAYEDEPLPTLAGQTISAPHMHAVMLELLRPNKKDLILEIGTGSGYNAALLSSLVKEVHSLEIFPELVELARKNLKKAGIQNVQVIHGDGSQGLPGKVFDKIVFTCAIPKIPENPLAQLKDPGLLLAPVGGTVQDLILLRKENRHLEKENHGGCVFVPLRKKIQAC